MVQGAASTRFVRWISEVRREPCSMRASSSASGNAPWHQRLERRTSDAPVLRSFETRPRMRCSAKSRLPVTQDLVGSFKECRDL